MPLTPYLTEGTFEPEAIEVMVAAFEAACHSLGLVDRDDPLTQMVAHKVIEIGRSGERDPDRLRDLVLRAFASSEQRNA